ncbi:methyltransferase family protein [Cellulomonas sp. NPDC057328]|uniref:methyltransferase family protein n=1 Tax=Cellulomonas sp. NPDC057328 TaxID=3346101 RepID=UPI0036313C2D
MTAVVWVALAVAMAATELRWANRRPAVTTGPLGASARAARASDDALIACIAVALVGPVVSVAALGWAGGPGWVAGGAALAVLGVLLRVQAMRALRGRFMLALSEQPDDPRLVRDRCYAVLRHPGYTALLLVTVGLALVAAGPAGAVWALPVLALVVARIHVEEAMLAHEFGAEYDRYRADVPARLVPRVW